MAKATTFASAAMGTDDATSQPCGDDEVPKQPDISQMPAKDLHGFDLEWSTIVPEERSIGKEKKKKSCLLCKRSYAGGPSVIRQHLDKDIKPRDVAPCKPTVLALHRYKEVLAELRTRAAIKQKQADVAANKRRAEEAARDNVAGRGHEESHQDDRDQKVFMKPSVEQVNEQWARAVVKKGLALDMVDDPEFRKAILMTARAGLTYVDSQKEEPKLPHRKHLTTKQIPALDEKLNAKVLKKIEGLLEETGCMIMSDGWTSTQNRPIINALQSTPAGARFLKAVDTSGDTKDAQYVADFICACIRSVGPENLVAVVMDGACKSSFAIIEKEFPHIVCFICPTHSVDNFLKNICSDKSTVTVKDTGEHTWGYVTHFQSHLTRPGRWLSTS